MNDLWNAYVFWMNEDGPLVLALMTAGLTYSITKRRAVLRVQRRLQANL